MTTRNSCTRCGFSNIATAAFCGNCGRALQPAEPEPVPEAPPVYCPHCESPNPAGAVFCGNCGRSMAAAEAKPAEPYLAVAGELICPACGAGNVPEAVFCGNCGYAFAATAPMPDKRGRLFWLLVPLCLLFVSMAAGLLLSRGDGLPDAVTKLFAAESDKVATVGNKDEDAEAIADAGNGETSDGGSDEPHDDAVNAPTGADEGAAGSTEKNDTPTPTIEPGVTASPTPSPTAQPTATATAVVLPTPTPTPIPMPDEIIFQSNRDGDFEIYIVNVDGTNLRQLTFNSVDDRFPRVSPDGRRIAYQSGRGTTSEIFVMNRDGSEPQRLTFNEVLDELPAWSPDGRRIVFAAWISRTDSELFVMDADGSNQRQITDTPLDEGHVSWSVAGLAFNGTEPGTSNYQLYTSDPDGGNRQRLTNSRIDEWSPEWSPDGTQMLFLSERGSSVNSGIYVMNVASGEVVPIYNNEDGRMWEWGAVWSADGRRIVFAMDQIDGTSDIYIMNADGTALQRVVERGGYPAWATGSN